VKEVDTRQPGQRLVQPIDGRHAAGHAPQRRRPVARQGRQHDHRLAPQHQPAPPAGEGANGQADDLQPVARFRRRAARAAP
jgi:hypothetical protein